MRPRLPATLLALALLASGCTGGGQDGRAVVDVEWTEHPSVPCPRLPSSLPPSQGPTVERLHDLRLEVAVGPVKLWGAYLSYPVRGERVVVCDLAVGRSAVVAERGEDDPTVYDYAVGAGDHAVYTRLSHLPDVTKKVDWAIEAVQLSTGERQVVAEMRGAAPDLVPRPAVAGRWVAWAQEEPAGVSVRVRDLASGRERTVAPARVQAGNVGLAEGGLVVFDGASGPAGGRDVFAVPADGSGLMQRLTSQGSVQPLVVANGRATWRNAAPGSAEGERWTMVPGRDAQPVRVHSSGRAVPGRDFLVTEEGEGLTVHGLRPEERPLPIADPGERIDPGALWDVYGHVVVWVGVEFSPGGELRRHLRIARVRR